jgi:hypothetical protein
MTEKGKAKTKGGGGRSRALAALLAIVALVAIWLSDCIPGFGLGSLGIDGEAQDAEQAEPVEKVEPAVPESEVEAEAEPPRTLKLIVEPRGCTVEGGEPFDCATLCERTELFAGVESVVIDATEASHATVTEVLDCLATFDVTVATTRK